MTTNRKAERKLPKHVKINEHKVGSVIFFSSNLGLGEEGEKVGPTEDQKFIRSLMEIIPRKHGRSWLTHVAVICEKHKDGKVHIGHATEKGDENEYNKYLKANAKYKKQTGFDLPADRKPDYTLGYVKESLDEQVERDKDRAFISFNPNGDTIYEKIKNFFGEEFCKQNNLTPEKVAKDLAKHIADSTNVDKDPGLNDVKWTFTAGAKAVVSNLLLNSAKLDSNRPINLRKQEQQDKSTICSEFGARAMKVGALSYFHDLYQQAYIQLNNGIIQNAGKVHKEVPLDKVNVKASDIPGYIHVKSNTTPKDLFNHLYKNSDYNMQCYLGNKPCNRLIGCLKNVLNDPKIKKSENKARENALKHLSEFENKIKLAEGQHHSVNETQAVVAILKDMLPMIKEINKNVYKRAIEVGEGMGIDKKDIKKFGMK